MKVFAHVQLNHITTVNSDHHLLLLDFSDQNPGNVNKNFRFEPLWLRCADFQEKVAEYWSEATGGEKPMVEILQFCSSKITTWNKNSVGSVTRKVKKLRSDLNEICKQERTLDTVVEEQRIKSQLEEWFFREELLRKQRSRCDWLKEGDKNTKFFHVRASTRRRMNQIRELKGLNGSLISEPVELQKLMVSHFQNIFSSSYQNIRYQLPDHMGHIRGNLSIGTIYRIRNQGCNFPNGTFKGSWT